MANEYGKKGGNGPTKGRKAETIVSPCGRYRKRVFDGQRWLVVMADEKLGTIISAFHSEENAQKMVDEVARDHAKDINRWPVHFYVAANPA